MSSKSAADALEEWNLHLQISPYICKTTLLCIVDNSCIKDHNVTIAFTVLWQFLFEILHNSLISLIHTCVMKNDCSSYCGSSFFPNVYS